MFGVRVSLTHNEAHSSFEYRNCVCRSCIEFEK